MKSFFWRIVICLLPCLWAGYVTSVAVSRYIDGEPGGIKMGVDLEGGTILVYEIDLKKRAEGAKDDINKTNLLAESLKRRIDPNDLKNIVIRPAGEGRVEIILPTGGVWRTQKAEAAWDKLKDEMGKKWGVAPGLLTVDRGNPDQLADKIQLIRSQETWQKTFSDPTAWKNLIERSYGTELGKGEWRGLPRTKEFLAKLHAIKLGDTAKLIEVLQAELRKLNPPVVVTETEMKNWIKREAWRAMEDKILEDPRWKKDLENSKDNMYAIRPDSHEQLIDFVYCKGNVMGQAFLSTLSPLMGPDILKESEFGTRAAVKKFIEENYGPSLTEIRDEIRKKLEDTNRTQDLTVEEVQRIKDLVSKVGSLEFLMLANNFDDKKAEEKAIQEIKDSVNQAELDDRQKDGLPPFGPRNSDKVPEMFQIQLPHGNKSLVTYRWVELGPQERKSLNLDNAAEFERERNATWAEAKFKRGQEAIVLHDLGKKKLLLNGALFYSRECLNRNISEEERRNKKVEYFVLARNPEIDPTDPEQKRQTPSIDGGLLVSAQSGTGSDLRPAVHFQFNAEGGRLFGDLTRKNVPSDTGNKDESIKRHLAIVLDGLVQSAPTILSQITTNGQISGGFTQKEVTTLVNILNSGSLPATLKPQPVSESMLGPTLGLDTIRAGVTAILIAFAAVLAFMLIYYRFAGLVASIALLANLLLTVGFMIGVQATFTLPGLAGLVLMLGMAVDANVLIYERLREERERGASLALSIRNGYDRALPIIIDTHLTGIFTAIVLYVVGNDQLRGFGVSLTAGLFISLFTSLFMTRLLFDIWLHKNWLHKLSMLKIFSKPNIDFMGIRNIMFVATITLAVLGIGLFIGRGTNGLNIDFIGGTAFGGQLTEPQSMTELRKLVDENSQKELLSGVNVKEIEGSGGHSYELTYPGEKQPRPITIVNPPLEGTNRAAEITKRASVLPDPSVEQIFPSGDVKNQEYYKDSKSKYFIIRSSEKEPELVQAVLDRLLSVKNKDGQLQRLMQATYVKMEPADPSNPLNRRLHFYRVKPEANLDDPADLKKENTDETKVHTPASPSFVKTLIARHLRLQFAGEKPPEFDVTGDGSSSEGRYSVMTFSMKSDVVAGLTPEQKDKVKAALQKAVDEFQARPQPDRLETFDSQLATETQYRAMAAIIASWGAILVYLWFRFGSWTFGAAAVICLIHDLFFTLGAIAACHFVDNTFLGHMFMLEDFKIDLPAVAALLTLIGYSVNDTIVVFDRIREIRGKNPDLSAKMINDSVNQTLSRTLLTSLVTWLVVIVLYVWGGPGVHLFGFVMVVGVIVGTYSSIYIASPLLLMFGEGVHPTSGNAPAPRPSEGIMAVK